MDESIYEEVLRYVFVDVIIESVIDVMGPAECDRHSLTTEFFSHVDMQQMFDLFSVTRI